MYPCGATGTCPNIATGDERCAVGTPGEDPTLCIILCTDHTQCPCGLSCTYVESGGVNVCLP